MGLQFNMSVYDLNYIEYTQNIRLYPNYAEGCRVFCDTFLAEAQARCPVKTGYLRSTISASSTASSITCMVEAEYAQYVEYGTSRQSAQPYFEPALQAAFAAAQPYWDEAEQEVIGTQRGWVQMGQSLYKEIDNFRYESGPATIKATSLSGTLIAALFSFLTALVRGLFNSLRAVFSGFETKQPDSNHSSWSSVSSFISTF